MKKRLFSIFLVIICIINTTVVKAETLEDYGTVEIADPIFIDGVEYTTEYDFETGNFVISGESKESEGTMVVLPNGKATIEIDNEKVEDEYYQLDIENLSENNVDVEMYDENGELVQTYTDYDELVEEVYEGQEAITITTVAVVCAAVALLYVCTRQIIIQSGIAYCIANVYTKAVASAKEAVRKKVRGYYYPTLLKKINGEIYVYINPNGININKAAQIVKSGGSMYSYTAEMARNVIIKAGYCAINSNLSKNKSERHSSKGIQFYHYHAGKSGFGKPIVKVGSIHSMYGSPTIYK